MGRMNRYFKRFSLVDVITAAVILGLTAIGLSLLSRALTWGVWAYSDSAEYIVSARMLLAGRGLGIPAADGRFMPLALHPPLYPLVISGILLLGMDPLDALPVFNLALFAATALLSGWMVYSLSRDPLLAVSTCALTVLPATMLRNFDGAMTEPLYFPLSIGAVYLLAWYWQKPRAGLAVAAGALTGLAGLTRYTGLALLAAGVLVILLGGQPFRRRLGDAALFTALGGGPLLIWFVYLYAQSGLLAARSIAAGGDLAAKVFLLRKGVMETLVAWQPYLTRVDSWKVKALVTYALIGLGAALGGLTCWRAFRRKAALSDEVQAGVRLMAAAFIAAAAYGIFVAVSFLFSSVTPDINDRTLAPLLPLLALFLCAAFFVAPRAFGLRRIIQIIPLILILAALPSFYMQTSSLANDRDADSRGYAAPRWRNSALMQAVRSLPPDTPLISNVPAAVLLHAGRMPYSIQELGQKKVMANPFPFGSGDDPAEEIFHQGEAFLILFQPELREQMGELYGEAGAARAEQFTAGLKVIFQTQDGAIYVYE
jgi:hypothetical protein